MININKLSFTLLVLPYLTFNWISLFQFDFFSFSNLLLLILVLLSIDFLIFKYTRSKNQKIFNGSIIIFTSLFFYGNYITIIFQDFVFYSLGFFIRGRFILVFSLSFTIALIVYLVRYLKFIKYFNVFLIIFSFLNFFNSYAKVQRKKYIEAIPSFQKITLKKEINKPLILLITDEYSSPDEFYKIFYDSSVYHFSARLKQANWIIRNKAFSHETSTIHSLSSLFNFNLSKDKYFSEYNLFQIGPNQLLHASIYDSLFQKKVNIINFGIFDIGKSKPISDFYYYPRNFFDKFLFYTTYRKVMDNTSGFKFEGFKYSYYPEESHNQIILENLTDSLKIINESKVFVYVHLLMPHHPFKYRSEFNIGSNADLFQYKKYWDFTNEKLQKLLFELVKENKYRIILTGDHGFRNDSRISSNHTFMAFYGFNESDLNSIQSVQDLGSLINASYK